MKKVLSQAIAAATIFGAAAAAQAVEINHGGEGEALLFPYYTVEDGKYTALHLTNTTDEYKAVKVRFRRSTDSADALDFNLYMSPKDMWTGAVVAGSNGIPRLVSADTSCISAFPDGIPAAGQEFGVKTKVAKGHIEIIEMASWDEDAAAAAKVDAVDGKVTVADAVEHQPADKNGIRKPGNCAAINASWNDNGGYWAGLYKVSAAANNPAYFAETDLGAKPTGGIYGNAYVINPDEAWASSFAPVALSGLYIGGGPQHNHHAPRYGLPDLHGGNKILLPKDLVKAEPEWTEIQYTQALDRYTEYVNLQNFGMAEFADIVTPLNKASIKSDFTLAGASEASTELVVTFPVKYTGNPAGDVEVGATFFDREEQEVVVTPDDWQLSPWLPGENVENNKLVHEVNVVHLGVKGDREDIGDATLQLNAPFNEGWVDINFVKGVVPVVGFTSTIIKNGTVLGNGGINSYALNFPLKYTE